MNMKSLSALAAHVNQDSVSRLQRLEFLVNSSPMVIYTSTAGGDFGATYVSEGARKLWGYEPADFIEKAASGLAAFTLTTRRGSFTN